MNKPVSGKSHWTVVEANQREEGQLLLDFTKWKIKRAHSQEAISGGKGLGGGALRSTGEMKEQGERIQLRPPGERKTAPSPGALLSLPLTLNTPQGNSFISQLFIRSIQSSLWPSGLGIWCVTGVAPGSSHCCDVGLIPDLGISSCCGCGKKQKQTQTKKLPQSILCSRHLARPWDYLKESETLSLLSPWTWSSTIWTRCRKWQKASGQSINGD